jgi:predicted TIM-barrel fold metal-dependent hydrolase
MSGRRRQRTAARHQPAGLNVEKDLEKEVKPMRGKELYGFPVFDCDGHITEPLAIWDTYLEEKYREPAKEHFAIVDIPPCGEVWVVEESFGPKSPTWQKAVAEGRKPQGVVARAGAYRPGRTPEGIALIDTSHLKRWAPDEGYMAPGGFDPHERIKDMDLEGIDKACIIPTFFAMAPAIKDPELAAALCKAYNDWALDFSQPYPDRFYPLCMLPVQDIELAAAEFQRVAGRGCKIACARPNPMAGHLVHEPYWYPAWELLQEANVPLLFHPLPTPDLAGGTGFINSMGLAGLADTFAFTLDNMVTMLGLIFHGVLDRYPRLKMAFIESSCSWVAGILDRADKRIHLFRSSWPNLKSLPSEIFKRQLFISFESAETAVPALAPLPLFQNNLIWASDYPHHDADPPAMAIKRMQAQGVPVDIQAKIMGTNAARYFGIPLDAEPTTAQGKTPGRAKEQEQAKVY